LLELFKRRLDVFVQRCGFRLPLGAFGAFGFGGCGLRRHGKGIIPTVRGQGLTSV